MKGKLSTIVLIVVFFVGLSVLLYPTVSNWWNTHLATHVIEDYSDVVANMDSEDTDKIWRAAKQYNKQLAKEGIAWAKSFEENNQYRQLLNVDADSDMMGYIEIEKIHVKLPVFHGVDNTALDTGVGHIPYSSLPVGGKSTHCILSAHRGLPSAKLFTDLDELVVGDTFVLNILDRTLTYEVDQIRIIEPDDLSELNIVEGKDYCTLMTCTPYGINTHRLLVRGHRIKNKDTSRPTSVGRVIEPLYVMPIVAVPILLVLFIVLLVKSPKKKH